MASKNYNEAVASKNNRQLTAKGNKFLWRCIDIVAASRASNRYAPEMKDLKGRLDNVIKYLLIDKELTINEVTEMIKQSRFLETHNLELN